MSLCIIMDNIFLNTYTGPMNGNSVSNGSFTSSKSNVDDFDFLKTDNWMNFTSHSQTSDFILSECASLVF